MTKPLKTIGIVVTTLIVIAIGIKFYPAGISVAEMTTEMRDELVQADQHHEAARNKACAIYATLYAQCLMHQVGACDERTKIETQYVAEFSVEASKDCVPESTKTESSSSSLNPLFFGDEGGGK